MTRRQRTSGRFAADRGFSLIELLVVVTIVGLLAAIAIPAYLNQRAKATNTQIKADLSSVHAYLLAYGVEHGTYPSTGGLTVVYASDGCPGAANPRADYVPLLGEPLPQPPTTKGHRQMVGCYLYASDGTHYVLSAWNLVQGNTPNTGHLYRRLGFREATFIASMAYYCNHANIGGGGGYGAYNANIDYYKWSYTFSNITACDETPPAGA